MTVHTAQQQPATIEFTSGKISCFRHYGIVSSPANLLRDAPFYICVRRKTVLFHRSSDCSPPPQKTTQQRPKGQAGVERECDPSEELPDLSYLGNLCCFKLK